MAVNKARLRISFYAAVVCVATGLTLAATSGWMVITSPSPNRENFLYAVSGISQTDMWAVGSQFSGTYNNIQSILAEHWDGKAWTVFPTPNPGTAACAPYWQNSITGVYMVSRTDVWAVGNQCTKTGSGQTLVERFNGTAWTLVPSPNKQSSVNPSSYLTAVTGSSSTDVWAAGDWAGGTWPNNGGGTLIEHWNGNSWRIVPSPSPSTHQQYSVLTGIAEISPSDVWVVGYTQRSIAPYDIPLIEHYNGTTWSMVSSPYIATSNTNELLGVTAISSNDVWAVGYANQNSRGQNGQGLIQHWDGVRWSLVNSPIAGYATDLYAVSATSSSDVWTVGYIWSPTLVSPITEHWDGTRWTVVTPPDPSKAAELFGSAVVSGTVWAVGAYSATSGNSLNLARTLTIAR